MKRLSLFVLNAVVLTLFVAPYCDAQKAKVWTRDNIHEWVDSNTQKLAKRELIKTASPKDRQLYKSSDWFFPPQMKIDNSRKGQLGRLVLPAYRVMTILDDKRFVAKVVDQPGRRYLAVFDLGDTSHIRVDNTPHISPDKFSLLLFERMDNYVYKDSRNVRQSLPVFKKIEPSEVLK